MGEMQGLIGARTDELRTSAQRFADASRAIEVAGRMAFPTGVLEGSALQTAIEIAHQRICASVIAHARELDVLGSAIAQSARSYDVGDHSFAESLTVVDTGS
ncbi:hypothetical protein GCM10007304_10990 [Rhodococcoides trifolii]|uniref:Uncharacterized protein n=1 Tax=Rhodococcoides trifolii TaxID=908250 RepID=A0A917CW69_9NOCA|nr:hypothetical protein [Rhodococcus trifolii]GGF98853.1 hypothetical protein GCM10007304_10990 [Rhodococcus trifolii]